MSPLVCPGVLFPWGSFGRGDFWTGGFLSAGAFVQEVFCPGGFFPGRLLVGGIFVWEGFCPGVFVREAFVRGVFCPGGLLSGDPMPVPPKFNA